jgi:hypothetical protein
VENAIVHTEHADRQSTNSARARDGSGAQIQIRRGPHAGAADSPPLGFSLIAIAAIAICTQILKVREGDGLLARLRTVRIQEVREFSRDPTDAFVTPGLVSERRVIGENVVDFFASSGPLLSLGLGDRLLQLFQLN